MYDSSCFTYVHTVREPKIEPGFFFGTKILRDIFKCILYTFILYNVTLRSVLVEYMVLFQF